jgi:hypothetical protein
MEVLTTLVPLFSIFCAVVSLVTVQSTHQLLSRKNGRLGKLIFVGKLLAIGLQLPLVFVVAAFNGAGTSVISWIVAAVACEFGTIWLTFHFAKKHPAWAKRTSDALDRFVQARTK